MKRNLDTKLLFVGIDEEEDKSIGVCGCSCTACSKTKNKEGKVKFAGYDRIPLKTSSPTGELSDHQYLVCSQKAYVSQKSIGFDMIC
jgi:hypothetical protein